MRGLIPLRVSDRGDHMSELTERLSYTEKDGGWSQWSSPWLLGQTLATGSNHGGGETATPTLSHRTMRDDKEEM